MELLVHLAFHWHVWKSNYTSIIICVVFLAISKVLHTWRIGGGGEARGGVGGRGRVGMEGGGVKGWGVGRGGVVMGAGGVRGVGVGVGVGGGGGMGMGMGGVRGGGVGRGRGVRSGRGEFWRGIMREDRGIGVCSLDLQWKGLEGIFEIGDSLFFSWDSIYLVVSSALIAGATVVYTPPPPPPISSPPPTPSM